MQHPTRLQKIIGGMFLLLLCFVPACTPPTLPTLPTWLGGRAPTPTPTPIAVTTELQLWRWPGTETEDAYLQQLLADFTTSEPTVAVEMVIPDNYSRRLQTAFSTDAAPDIFLLNLYQLPDFVAAGHIAPLPANFDQTDRLYPHIQRAIVFDDHAYCVPQFTYTLALFYNRTLFDAVDMAYPDTNWQWETLQTTAAALTDLEANRYGLVLSADVSRWAAFLVQAGATLPSPADPQREIDTPAANSALQFYTSLVLEAHAATPSTLSSQWPGETFARGDAAMMIEANWAIAYLDNETPDLDYGVAVLPMGPAGNGTISFTTCYAIAQQSENQMAAARLLAHLTTPEAETGWFPNHNTLPTQSILAVPWRAAHPSLVPFLEGNRHAVEWQLPAGFQPWILEMNEGLTQIFGGFIPAAALLPQAEESAKAISP